MRSSGSKCCSLHNLHWQSGSRSCPPLLLAQGESKLQVPHTGIWVLDNPRPFLFLHSSIVGFWITLALCKECEYHILGNNLVKLCFSSPKITHLFRQFRPPTEDFLSNNNNKELCTLWMGKIRIPREWGGWVGALLRKSSVGGRNCLNKWVIFGLEKHNFTKLFNHTSPDELIQGHFGQYRYTRNVPVFTNTGMFRYQWPKVYLFHYYKLAYGSCAVWLHFSCCTRSTWMFKVFSSNVLSVKDCCLASNPWLLVSKSLRARSQIPVYGLTGRGLGGRSAVPGAGFCGAKSWNNVYSMHRYPFMNNNGCQICFILLPKLLVWIEIINIQKLVTHVTHWLSGV